MYSASLTPKPRSWEMGNVSKPQQKCNQTCNTCSSGIIQEFQSSIPYQHFFPCAYLKDLGPIHGHSAVSCEGLVDLPHHCDDSRMEGRVTGRDHVQIVNVAVLLPFMRLKELLRLRLSIILAVNIDQGLLGQVHFALENEPPRTLRQPADNQEQHERVCLHYNNGHPP